MSNSVAVEGTLTYNAAAERLVSKVQEIKASADAWGEFTLFGLFQQRGAGVLWDVVVSAPWLPSGREGILRITQVVTPRLTVDEALMISRVVVLPPDSPFVRAIQDITEGHGGQVVRVGPLALDGIEIERGYILEAHRNPLRMQAVA